MVIGLSEGFVFFHRRPAFYGIERVFATAVGVDPWSYLVLEKTC